jgi:UDP-N-acetylmuramoyl-tripeptide--D-alanyl-D-alanine ligase
MQWTAAQIAEVTGGRLVGPDVVVDGATQDSRGLRPGQLFVAVRAERDGHEFIGAALAAGAGAYLTERAPEGGTAVVVADTLAALEALGRAAIDRLPGRIVGITGSVGKTSTKDLAASVLAQRYATHASHRSFNNEIGVPLTLLGAPEGTEAVVVEMGARGIGHVADLCAVARPTIGVVTAVGAAHLELFGSIDAIAVAKGELVESLAASGTAVLNADDERVLAMGSRTEARVLTYGTAGEVRAESVVLDDLLRATFELRSPWGSTTVVLGARGLHNVHNALAAAAVGLVEGLDLAEIAAGLADPELSPWRMEIGHTPTGAVVLNDAYNANPVSMAAALRSLASLPAQRRTAVLGVMAELGGTADDEHARIGALAAELGVRVIAVGAPGYAAGGGRVEPVADVDEAVAALGPVGVGDAVLVKASRVAGLERLAAQLLAG